MAYKLMTRLIEMYENGKGSNTKETLIEKCEAYYATNRLTTEQYTELMTKINALA